MRTVVTLTAAFFVLLSATDVRGATNCYSGYGSVSGAIGIPSGQWLYSLTETTYEDVYIHSAFWNKGVFSWIKGGSYTHQTSPPGYYMCGMYCHAEPITRIGWYLSKGDGLAWYEVNTDGHPWEGGPECRWGFDNGYMSQPYYFLPIWMEEDEGPYYGSLHNIDP
jgi:hypothetical protein